MSQIGIVNLHIIRGNTKEFNLSFFETLVDGTEVPINLTLYDSIKMDIKKRQDINSPVLQAFIISDGLSIFGSDNNILRINFNREFIDVNDIQYYYDILFEKGAEFETLIKGMIDIKSVVTI